MKILSLFDGMSCGMLAFQKEKLPVDKYVAYEIDKYAIKTSEFNFPNIEHKGDVFEADFSQYEDFDFLIGGSPCTYWSIAQKNNRETEASGLGWELFSQYLRALKEAKPKYFIYENNKSMSNKIRDSIRKNFGFEEICINSSLVSAQNRKRYYWVGKKGLDGEYTKIDVLQPEDLHIYLKDILDISNSKDLTDRELKYMLREEKSGRNHFDYGYYHSALNKKSHCLTANISKGVPYNVVCEPVNVTSDGKAQTLKAQYIHTNIDNFCRYHSPSSFGATGVAEPVRVGCLPSPDGSIKGGQANRIYSANGKSVNLTAQGGGLGAKTGLYALPIHTAEDGVNDFMSENDFQFAVPCEWDENGVPTKAISGSDEKVHTVYNIENGLITIKGSKYPIKLANGFWIIRKLTVSECKRLQTVPEWYEFPVSETQALKMLGNGWTCDVISHLIKSCLSN